MPLHTNRQIIVIRLLVEGLLVEVVQFQGLLPRLLGKYLILVCFFGHGILLRDCACDIKSEPFRNVSWNFLKLFTLRQGLGAKFGVVKFYRHCHLNARMRAARTTRSKMSDHVTRRGICSSFFGSRRRTGVRSACVHARRVQIITWMSNPQKIHEYVTSETNKYKQSSLYRDFSERVCGSFVLRHWNRRFVKLNSGPGSDRERDIVFFHLSKIVTISIL